MDGYNPFLKVLYTVTTTVTTEMVWPASAKMLTMVASPVGALI